MIFPKNILIVIFLDQRMYSPLINYNINRCFQLVKSYSKAINYPSHHSLRASNSHMLSYIHSVRYETRTSFPLQGVIPHTLLYTQYQSHSSTSFLPTLPSTNLTDISLLVYSFFTKPVFSLIRKHVNVAPCTSSAKNPLEDASFMKMSPFPKY